MQYIDVNNALLAELTTWFPTAAQNTTATAQKNNNNSSNNNESNTASEVGGDGSAAPTGYQHVLEQKLKMYFCSLFLHSCVADFFFTITELRPSVHCTANCAVCFQAALTLITTTAEVQPLPTTIATTTTTSEKLKQTTTAI